MTDEAPSEAEVAAMEAEARRHAHAAGALWSLDAKLKAAEDAARGEERAARQRRKQRKAAKAARKRAR